MAIYQGNKKVGYNIDTTVYSTCPIGTILSYGGSEAPYGYLLCNGSEVDKITYSDLYNIIGDTYGTSTDNTKFKLPDLRDKFVQGANGNLGTSKNAGLPNITGEFYQDVNAVPTVSGAFIYKSGERLNLANSQTASSGAVAFDASKSNSIYGNSDTVQPPSVCLNYIIKALNIKDKSLDTKELFSTDEIKTNKVWIDGKPIYKKVITQTITTPNRFIPIGDFDISLIDSLISIYGSIKQSLGNITPISFYNNANDGAFVCMSKEDNRFVLYARESGVGDVILIVEYTKTTD